MIAEGTRELIIRLRLGKLDAADASAFEGISARELVEDLRFLYPVVFQERRVGRKSEVGMARRVKFELAARKLPHSAFVPMVLRPVLSRCLFLSAYEDSISEISVSAGIGVWPKGDAVRALSLKMGNGYKLDRTPDGWAVKLVRARGVVLAEAFLADRGWKFDALTP